MHIPRLAPVPCSTGSLPGQITSVLALVLSILWCCPDEQAARAANIDRPPNIIFIMADDLGHGHLGCYGQRKINTPHLDQLAAEGLRFTQAYSGSAVCAPARSVLMTGLHTGRTPIRNNGRGNTLQASDVTVAEVLQQAGYATGGFGKWGLGIEGSPGVAIQQGFDTWVGQYSQVHAHFYYPYFLWKNDERLPLPENEGLKQGRYAHDVIHEHALEFIERHAKAGRPFFAYLPYIIPHVELVVPEEDERPYRQRDWPKLTLPDPRDQYLGSDDAYVTYAGMISRLDRHVGEVVRLVERLGIADNTLIVFTSDNGTQGGTWDPLIEFFDGNGKLRGKKGVLYEGGIRVPMIARWTGTIEPGRVTDHPTYFPDVLPTLAEVAGLDGSALPEHDGISLVPLLRDTGEQPEHAFMYWEIGRGRGLSQAVRHGKWKAYRRNQASDWELYDLSKDESETTDVAGDHPRVLQEVEKFIARTRTEPRRMPPGEPEGWQDFKR